MIAAEKPLKRISLFLIVALVMGTNGTDKIEAEDVIKKVSTFILNSLLSMLWRSIDPKMIRIKKPAK